MNLLLNLIFTCQRALISLLRRQLQAVQSTSFSRRTRVSQPKVDRPCLVARAIRSSTVTRRRTHSSSAEKLSIGGYDRFQATCPSASVTGSASDLCSKGALSGAAGRRRSDWNQTRFSCGFRFLRLAPIDMRRSRDGGVYGRFLPRQALASGFFRVSPDTNARPQHYALPTREFIHRQEISPSMSGGITIGTRCLCVAPPRTLRGSV